jgi:hypothetical protein
MADGGSVDLAAPGIAILSAAPRPRLYHSGSGTGMAAPRRGVGAGLLQAPQ